MAHRLAAGGDRTELSMDHVGGLVPGPKAARILNRLTWYADRPIPTVDASSTAEDVVAAYVDLLNADAYNEAFALWSPRAGEPDLPTAYSRIDATVERVRRLRFLSSWQDAVAVTALYREVPLDGSYTEYRRAVFMLGRDEGGVLRIVGVQVGEVVPTGR